MLPLGLQVSPFLFTLLLNKCPFLQSLNLHGALFHVTLGISATSDVNIEY